MGLLTGSYLCPNVFEWPAGTKSDGSRREAGKYVGFHVYEDGPSPAMSPVIEVQVPDKLHVEFEKWQLNLKRLAPVKIYVEHSKKGKARLLGFAE